MDLVMIDSLSKIFHKITVLCNGKQACHALIKETDSLSKLKKITISHLTEKCFVLGLDEGRNISNKISGLMSPLFDNNDTCSHNKVCDVLIFKQISDNLFDVVYIELKSNKPTGYEEQFKSSMCFVRYVESIFSELCDKKLRINNEIFVILHTCEGKPSINKSRTKPKENVKSTPKTLKEK